MPKTRIRLHSPRSLRSLRLFVVTLAACCLIGSVLWFTSPVLRAQDNDPLLPGDAKSQLFLPAISGGQMVAAGEIIPGEFIVVLHDAVTRAAAGQNETAQDVAIRLSSDIRGDVLFTYASALSGFAVRVPAEEAELAASSLANDPNVAYVEPNRVVRAEDTQTGPTWGLDRIDQANLPLSASYTYANSGAGVHAYVIDTGIRATHTQFSGRVGNGYTAISDGQGTNDCQGHGTHVSGTVGGATYGVAKQVTLHPVRVLNCSGFGSNAGVIAGIDWVTANHQKPAVANMSLGGSVSSALDAALRTSIAAGITYAVAAGNENQNACNVSPARTTEALTVGATTSSDARSSFSNFGTCLDIFAPGSSITSAVNSSDTATATYNGTSMASPHVAGAAALYLAANPTASPAQVAQALITNATLNKVTGGGTGSPNRLLYVGFIGAGGPTATATATNTATATPTKTPTATPTATPTNTPIGAPTTIATATATATPIPTATVAPPATCTNLLANPGFESGRVNWAESSSHGYALICSGASCGGTATARTGSFVAWLGGTNSEASQIGQPVNLPAGQKVTLSFWRRTTSSDSCGYDYGYVRVLSNGVTTTVKSYSLCKSTNTNGWVNAQVDLSAYAGRTVTLIFRAATDVSLSSSLFVDDVQLVSGNSCVVSAGSEDVVEPALLGSGEDIAPSTQPKSEGGVESDQIRQ